MKKIFTLIAVAAMAMSANAQTTIYSWEGGADGATETGGKVEHKYGADNRLNYSNGGYYTMCLNGKKANITDTEASNNASRMEFTLDQALAAGDVIAITAYVNKDASKVSGAYILFANGQEAESEDYGDAENIHADFNGKPATKNITISSEAAGNKSFVMTRKSNGTNLFITKFVITRGGEAGINTVKAVEAENGAAYNLAGQKVADGFKGVVIKNGKKMIQE
jgi:hypothetical protein